MRFFKFESKDKENENDDLNEEKSIPLQNKFIYIQPMNEPDENNNLFSQRNERNEDRESRRNSIRKGSSYIRSIKKENNKIAEKRALGELYNLITYKFNNSTETELEGNFQLNLNIPYQVIIYLIRYKGY